MSSKKVRQMKASKKGPTTKETGKKLELKTFEFLEKFLSFDPFSTIPAPAWLKLKHDQFSKSNQSAKSYKEFSKEKVNEVIKNHIKKMKNNSFIVEPTNNKGVEHDFVIKWRDRYYLIDAKNHTKVGKSLFKELDGQAGSWGRLRGQKVEGSFLLAGPKASASAKEGFLTESDNLLTKPITSFVLESLEKYVSAANSAKLTPSERADLILTKLFRSNRKEIDALKLACFPMHIKEEENALALLKSTAHEMFPYIDIEEFDYGSLNGYQREIDPKRVKNIASFLDGGHGFWPNTIVLSCDDKNLKIKNGKITIPGFTNILKIVDGQHRFFGSLWSSTKPMVDLPICIVKTRDEEARAFTFLKINAEAKAVNDSLMMEMYRNPKVVQRLLDSAAHSSKQKNIELARHWSSKLLFKLNRDCWTHKFAIGKKDGLPATNIWKLVQKILLAKHSPKTIGRYATLLQIVHSDPTQGEVKYKEIEDEFIMFFNAVKIIFDINSRLLFPGGLVACLTLWEKYFLKSGFDNGVPKNKVLTARLNKCASINEWDKVEPEHWRGGPGHRALYQILALGCNGVSTKTSKLSAGKEPDESDPTFEEWS